MDRKHITINDEYGDVRESHYGVYGYFDDRGTCLYVGIDSQIHKNARHMHHQCPSKRTEQDWNRYLQSPAGERITYSVLAICRDKYEMENIETMYILFFKALGQCRFNKAIQLSNKVSDEIVKGIQEMHRN